MSKTHVLLVNLGTPDSPSVTDVRKYLREFLMDRRVIDIPFLQRFFLINCIIAPFRAPKSAKNYKQVWTEEGSPLKVFGFKLKDLVQKKIGEDYIVSFAMRYQSPSIKSVLDEIKSHGVNKLIVVPLYPQYASSSTGSTIEKVFQEVNKWENVPEIKTVNQFCNDELFIKAFTEIGQKYLKDRYYDHVIFSYHGLPERHIKKCSVSNYCQLTEKCCSNYNDKNQFCYRAQCHQTTRLLVHALKIPEDKFTVCFQSRLGRNPWIKPYTDQVIVDLAKHGKKSILAFSPSFVADCLETTIEVGVEYRDLFKEAGGDEWQMVESLNLSETWIKMLSRLITEKSSI